METTVATKQDDFVAREEILSIPKKIYDYVIGKLKYDGCTLEGRYSSTDLSKLSELSVIKFGTAVGSIGYKINKTSSDLLLWTHPSYDSNYKVEVHCGLFCNYTSSCVSVREEVMISFPSFGLTLFNPDEISIISLVLEGLKNVTPLDPFRRVK